MTIETAATKDGVHATVQPAAAQSRCVRPPRILLIAASPRYVGGRSVMAQRLLTDLRSDGVEADFLQVDPLLPGFLRPFDRIKYVRTLLRSFFYLISLVRTVPQYDVIHIFSASYASFLISPAPALVVARLFGKPSILNYRSGEARDHLQRSGRFTRWLIRLATCIVVPSNYLVDVFGEFGYFARAIPNHVDTSLFTFHERSSVWPRILISRMLEPLYNIECALRALRIVQEKCPRAELRILGDGSQRGLLETLASELQLSNVTFTGAVTRGEIVTYYNEADVFLNTSSIDNMPVSIIESFASGLPVVTTDAGGIPYLITDRVNGHLVAVDDHQSVAERLLELINNPGEVRRLSQAGQGELRKYTWEFAGKSWHELYQILQRTPLTERQAAAIECPTPA